MADLVANFNQIEEIAHENCEPNFIDIQKDLVRMLKQSLCSPNTVIPTDDIPSLTYGLAPIARSVDNFELKIDPATTTTIPIDLILKHSQPLPIEPALVKAVQSYFLKRKLSISSVFVQHLGDIDTPQAWKSD